MTQAVGSPDPWHHPSDAPPIDLALFPLRSYHLLECLPVARDLQAEGLVVAIINSDPVRAEKEVSDWAASNNMPFWDIRSFLATPRALGCAVFFNDWDAAMQRVVGACTKGGVTTVGWVEGIQDYLDRDTGMARRPYQRLDHIILPGEFDRRYFTNGKQDLHIGQVRRLLDLQAAARSPIRSGGATGKALINSNFSYGVLEHCRDAWLESAVAAVRAAGMTPVISRHPFDVGTLFPDLVTDLSFYDAMRHADVVIQRFASGILEALAAHVPVIYYPPHEEKVDKFSDPQAAYSIAHTGEELTGLLKRRAFFHDPTAAHRFLHHHAGLPQTGFIDEGRLTHLLKEIIAKSGVRRGKRHATLDGTNLFPFDTRQRKKTRHRARKFLNLLQTFFKHFRAKP